MTAMMSAPSESMQMYLVTIARLREEGEPVPLSLLAETLSISPVSVNEMCRKLQDMDLLIYQPYKGATLTPEGERRALAILRRHRLWEVLLVRELGFAYDGAHQIACQLEHATPELLADRLDLFLDRPRVNPLGEPIPPKDGQMPSRATVALPDLSAGQGGHVVRCDIQGAPLAFLTEHGIRPGASFAVLGTTAESILIDVQGTPISLARTLAQAIQVEPEKKGAPRTPLPANVGIAPPQEQEIPQMLANDPTKVQQLTLDRLRVGQRGAVVRIGSQGAAKRRMMDMGLVPGTEVTVKRVAPLGDPIEFIVKGYSLSLRKAEARHILVEVQE